MRWISRQTPATSTKEPEKDSFFDSWWSPIGSWPCTGSSTAGDTSACVPSVGRIASSWRGPSRPAQVTDADLLELEVSTGEVVGDAGGYLERHHAGIYRARPDVQAVVHNHAAALIPFGVTAVALRPVAHVAGFLGAGVPVFDIRSATGSETSMLVDNPALGDLLACSLQSAPIVLMRGHGATLVADSLKQALYRSVYAVQNAVMQAEAMRLGDVNFLSEGECRQAAATIDRGVDRVWDNWVRQLPADLANRP